MWGRKRRERDRRPDDTASARRSQERAEAVIRLVETQHEEVVQIVNRLQRREPKNHFAESMKRAMGGTS